jgi:hypothetical protein
MKEEPNGWEFYCKTKIQVLKIKNHITKVARKYVALIVNVTLNDIWLTKPLHYFYLWGPSPKGHKHKLTSVEG